MVDPDVVQGALTRRSSAADPPRWSAAQWDRTAGHAVRGAGRHPAAPMALLCIGGRFARHRYRALSRRHAPGGQDLPSVSSRASSDRRRLIRRCMETSSFRRGEGGTASTGQAAWATQYRPTDGNRARIAPRDPAPITRRSSARSAVSTSARPAVPRTTRPWNGTPGPASPRLCRERRAVVCPHPAAGRPPTAERWIAHGRFHHLAVPKPARPATRHRFDGPRPPPCAEPPGSPVNRSLRPPRAVARHHP